MKKSRIFMVAGSLILAISGIFATKANKKFAASISTVYANGVASNPILAYNSPIFTTHSGTGLVPVYMLLYTVSGSTVTGQQVAAGQLYDKTGTNKPVLVNHATF